MTLSEFDNIGIQHESMQKNVSTMIEVYNDLEIKFHNLLNAFYLYEDTFSGVDLLFLKKFLQEAIDDIVQVNSNETNKIVVLQDLLSAYEGQVSLMNQEITQSTSSLNDNLSKKGLK